ncbi:MAG: ATP-binding cassette domain-containing protein [Geminicoccaceae bacterium]|nr:ATP-binding cassette domain-containing protein [Geminicoccaceae bacterium]
MTVKIAVRGLEKAFGPKRVLQGVDLDVPEKQSTVIIGGSGTGKSVLLKCIIGLITPDGGSIRIDGREMVGASDDERRAVQGRIGMLFQGAALFDSLPVWENVAFGLLAEKRLGRHEAREEAVRVMRSVGLAADVADRYPAETSGGMQKRIGLARAIATKPEIIFFDEPTTGLDPIMADVINDLVRACVRDLGATAVSISHDMASVRKIADRVALIHEGRIRWEGPASSIDASGNAYVDQFIHGRAEGPIRVGQVA